MDHGGSKDLQQVGLVSYLPILSAMLHANYILRDRSQQTTDHMLVNQGPQYL